MLVGSRVSARAAALVSLLLVAPAPRAAEFTQVSFPSGWDGDPRGGWDYAPVWSPRSDLIAYQDEYIGGPPWWELIVNFGLALPEGPRGIVWADSWYNVHPSFSPGGDRIAFEGQGYLRRSIKVVSVLRGEVAELAGGLLPEWSPDGIWIAYTARPQRDTFDIWLVPANGGPEVRVTQDSYVEQRIRWSPDGSRIAYDATIDGDADVFVVARTGGEPTRLTTSPAHDSQPEWSPDGKTVAFVSERSGNRDIWLVPAAGGTPEQVTTHPSDDVDPDWSPDGSAIVFASERAPSKRAGLANWDIFVYSLQGELETQLTTNFAADTQPTWSPDGSWIAFTSSRTGTWAIWVASDLPDFSTPVDEGSWTAVKSLFR